MPVMVLAHGTLGWWDEIIFLGVAVIFLIIMGVSWLRSRTTQPTFDDAPEAETAPETPSADRFRLD